MDSRPSKDQYYMSIAMSVSMRSNCCKKQTGAIIVRGDVIVSTGYNGTPRNVRNCFEGGCNYCLDNKNRNENENCRCAHAEANVIAQAARRGIMIDDGIMYITYAPCLTCAKLIINAGISEVIYDKSRNFNLLAEELLIESGVVIRQIGHDSIKIETLVHK